MCKRKTKGDFLFMQENQNFLDFKISDADRSRFRRIVLDVMTEAISADDSYDGIGRLGEKQMHAAIKRFICPNTSCHEIKIDGSIGCNTKELPEADNGTNSADKDAPKRTKGKKTATKTRKFVADVLDGGTIYEIQTGSFAPLREKIRWILDNTSYNIVLIHPIAETKWISTISRDGKIGPRKKSPKKESLRDIAGELYFISEFLTSPRFSLVILTLEAEQYKKNTAAEGKRPRYKKYELIPISLLRAHIFRSLDDYRIFIPDDLPEVFTVKDFSARSKIFGLDAYSIVKTLSSLGFFEPAGKIGRAQSYQIKH